MTFRQAIPPTNDNGYIITPLQEIESLVNEYKFLNPEQQKLIEEKYVDAYQYYKRHMHRYLTPNGKQAEFIRLKPPGTKFDIRILLGGNDTGKTTVAVNIIRNLVFPPENPYFSGLETFEKFKRPNRGRIISDPTTIDEKIIPELKKWMDAGQYETKRKGKLYDYWWSTSTKCEWDILSYEQDIKEFESVDLDWAVFDERLPEAVFKATISRLRDGGLIIIVSTPLSNLAWVEQDLLERNDVQYITASKEDNCKEHGIRGIRDHATIEEMISFYDEDEVEARAFGRFMHLSGRIYKTFSKNIHVIDDVPLKDIIQNQSFLLINVLDPHDRKPFVFLWAIVTSTLDIVIVKEFPIREYHKMKSSDYTIGDYIYTLREFEGEFKDGTVPIKPDLRVIDPFYGNRRRVGTEENATIKEEFEDKGYYFENANTDVAYNRIMTKEYLKYDPAKPVNNFNRPKLYMYKSCKNAKYGLQNHVYAENKDSSKEVNEKGADTKAKCFANCIEYLCSLDLNFLLDNKYPVHEEVTHQHRHAGY